MGRRRISDDGGVSLFPFMSILACLIGILTLMISVMTQLNSPDTSGQSEEDIARAKKRTSLITIAEGLETELEELEKRVKKERASATQLVKLRDERAKREKRADELAKLKKQSPAELKKAAGKHQQEIASLIKRRAELEKKAKEIQSEIKQRKEAPDPPKSVQVRPGGSGWNRPSAVFFVECDDQGIRLIRKGHKPQRIKTDQIANSAAYKDFLSKIKTVRDPMVLYLIRRTGYSSYRWAAHEAIEEFELRTGKLPLPNDGELDLTLFE